MPLILNKFIYVIGLLSIFNLSPVVQAYEQSAPDRANENNQPSLLDEIINSKIIRIATTGDYRPFSYYNKNTELAGIDIELARSLARSLGAEIKWVKTSWPSLSQDLENHKFDIAMSGISKNLSRQKIGLFSTSYFISGKTPIARCSQKDRFTSLENINKEGVTVIVNPGGTNEKFVNQHINQASILIYNDNNGIFQQIINGKADVMITDNIEVSLQSKLHPELCATMATQTFNRFDKAYLMPRDHTLKEYVNHWLNEKLNDGTVADLLNRYTH